MATIGKSVNDSNDQGPSPDLQERYRFVAKLNSSGIADVFLGVQKGPAGFQRLVVIKRVHSLWLGQKQNRKNFVDGVLLVSDLSHPNIVEIFDVGNLGNDVCIAMEYVGGENLHFLTQVLKKEGEQLALPIACRLMIETLDALQYAHGAKGRDGQALHLVHRDICPQNLMLDTKGNLKLIGFGITKSHLYGNPSANPPGTLKVQYSYMAPDFFQYNSIDHRVDLYALGLVFYELVTLRKVFPFRSGVTVKEVYDRIINDEVVNPSQVRLDLSSEFDKVIRKSLHKDRNQRYQSAESFGQAIRQLAKDTGGLATNEEVAAWFHTHFTTRITRRQEFESRALEKYKEIEKRPLSNSQLIAASMTTMSTITHARESLRQKHSFQALVVIGVIALVVSLGGYLIYQLSAGWSDPFDQPLQRPSTISQQDNLLVRSIPAGAELFLNGRFIGKVPDGGLRVYIEPSQRNKLELDLNGYRPYTSELVGSQDGLRVIEAQLVPLPD